MKKLLVGLLVLVILLVGAVFVAPSVIDLRPSIAGMVHAATGRTLRIDGPLQIALLPRLSVSASGVHLSEADGAAGDMVAVDRIALQARWLPLLGGRLVVDSLVVEHPTVALSVDAAGRPNWVFQVPDAAPAPAPAAAGDGGSAIDRLAVGSVLVTRGTLTYRNATTGQAINASDITLSGSMPQAASPLALHGDMTLNGEKVAADLSIDSLGKLQAGGQAAVKLALDTRHLTATFDGTAQQRPVPGLDGVFDLAIPSVGRLASWLRLPLDPSQPDPGPLKMHAAFTTDGAKSVLKAATLTGTALDLKASGTLDASGGATKVSLIVDSGVLDIDRYLPPPTRAATAPPHANPPGAGPVALDDPFKSLSDTPFAVNALRRLDGDIQVSIAGIKAMGYQVGRIGFTATAKQGVLTADLAPVPLYGGSVKGALRVITAGDVLGTDLAVDVAHVDVGRLARVGIAGPPPVSGIASASLDAKARGANPRALAASLHGRLTADLGGMTGAGSAQGLSRLNLKLDLPGGDKGPTVAASGVYQGEPIDVTATLAPLQQLAGGGRFPVKLALASKPISLHYAGMLQQKPDPGLDGVFDLDIPSVARFVAWAGQRSGQNQPDPGPLKLHAVLSASGPKVTVKEAVLTGQSIKATAQGSYDSGSAPAAFQAKVDVAQADLDPYLAAFAPPADASPFAKPDTAPARRPSPDTGWSTEPFDVSAMGAANGIVDVGLHAVHYGGLDVTAGTIRLVLADRVLKLTTDKLTLAQGTIDSAVTLSAAGPTPQLDAHVAATGLQARPLLQAFAGTGRLGGTIAFESTVKGAGRNQRDLVSSLEGKGSVKVTNGAIYGINLAKTLRNVGSLGFAGTKAEQTDFAELSGSYTIRAGVIDNRDMRMLAPLFRLGGGGTVPLPSRSIDYTVEAKLVASLEGQGGNDALAGVPIPIRLTGPWSKVDYQIDWAGAFRAIASDPARLKNLPTDLGKAAKDLGVQLPIPGLPQSPAQGDTPPTLPFSLPKNLFGK